VHLTTNPVDWYAARAGGVVAYVLLTSVVLLGLSLAGKRKLKIWPRFAVEDVHRFGGILMGTFVGIHVLAIAIDAYLPFSIPSLIFPLVSSYKPLWVGLGIIAAELLIALAVANHYRRRLSYRFWRRTHYLNFVVWGAATVHLLGSGTDRSSWWLLTITAVSVGLVCDATVLRVLRFKPRREPILRWAPAAASAVAVVLVLALGLGPFRFHSKPWNASAFSEPMNGQILQNLGGTRGLVSMAGSGVGSQPVLLRADLLIGQEGLLSTVFQMEYLPSGLSCRGHVTNVQNAAFDATCTTPDGHRRAVSASWVLGDSAQITGGRLSVQPA
jgi:methionine sulfoxide reductase heme-binding subunit